MSDQFIIEDARREQGKLRLALTGSTGAGKTFTALNIGTRLGEKVCLIDTENHSASKYGSGRPFTFKTIVLKPPYSLEKYIAAIQFVEKQGFDVCIIDSLTHAWAGAGGALEAVDDAVRRSRSGNSYTAWRDVTPLHRKLIETILQSNMHVIATMRSKMDFVQEKDDKGRTNIRKVGLAPVQRDDMAYEFDIVGDLDSDHVMVISKSRCLEIADMVIRKPGEDFATILKNWLSEGDALPAPEPPKVEEPVSGAVTEGGPGPTEPTPPPSEEVTPGGGWTQERAIKIRQARESLSARLGVKVDDKTTRDWINRMWGHTSHKQLTAEQADLLLKWMQESFRQGRLV